MKKIYITPSIKVRTIVSENIMAASPSGFTVNGDGSETQTGVDPDNPGETVNGGSALGKGNNVWNSWDE